MYKNQNNLGAPFDKEVVNGRILLVRMDHNADHKDFTLKEYLESTRYHQAPPQNNA
jgi:hypothetical protein